MQSDKVLKSACSEFIAWYQEFSTLAVFCFTKEVRSAVSELVILLLLTLITYQSGEVG